MKTRSPIRKLGTRGRFSEANCKKLDTLLRIRLRFITGGRCEECGKSCTGFDSQISHGFTRKIRSLRWERLNTILSCASCHWRRNNAPATVGATLIRLLGQAGYDELVRRWQRKTNVRELDYDLIADYIRNLEPGQYPKVSLVPLWELGK